MSRITGSSATAMSRVSEHVREAIALAPEDARAMADLAIRIGAAMRPVEPPANVVRSLRKELVKAAAKRQKEVRRVRRGLIIGAAALGSIASMVGVIVTVVIWRRRTHGHARLVHG